MAVYKTDKRHKAWQLTQPLHREVEGEGLGGPGPSILWLAPFNVTHYAQPFHEGSTAQGIRIGQSCGAQELGGRVFCDRTISGCDLCVRALMGQQSRRVSIQVGGTAVQIIIKPLHAGWLPHGHGNYMVGKPLIFPWKRNQEKRDPSTKCRQAPKI